MPTLRHWARRIVKPDAIVLHLDAPVPDQTYAAWLDIHGWALSMNGFALQCTVQLDEGQPQTVPLDQPTPTVAAAFPRHDRAATCGFHLRLSRDAFPDEATTRVTSRAFPVGTKPDWSSTTITRVVRRHDTRVVTHRRGAFGEVWDSEAITEARARAAVSGTGDATEFDTSGRVTADDLARTLAIGVADTVLEIGCGVGRIGKHLAPRCGRWIGADVSPRMLAHASANVGLHERVAWHTLNGFDLVGIESESIDVAYCSGVFMHLDEWDRYRYVREMYRVLRPGGRAWFDNINLLDDDGWQTFLALCDIDSGARPPHITKCSTPAELATYAKRAGFDAIRVREGGIYVTITARRPGDETR